MVSQNTTSNRDIGFTHEDFAALLDEYDYHFNPGDIVPGVVFSVEPRGALIDIGAKTAAYIPIQEMSINRVEEPDEVLQPEETREFFILTDENEDGQLTLSIRRIEYMRAWERVRQLQAEDATVRSGVFATNRGGALVRIEGLRGFIPGSHISTRQPKEDLVAQDLPLKFLEVDEERNRLVLSHRRALVERKMSGLKVGEVVIGSVRGIKPYGAFIDIGGVSGLLHISEISHDHIDTPSSVFDINDELKVMIIDLDAERGRISLSTKQLEPIAGAMLNNRELVFEQADKMAQRFRRKLQYQTQGLASEEIETKLNEEFGPIGKRPGETAEAEKTEAVATETTEAETETTADSTKVTEDNADDSVDTQAETETTADSTEVTADDTETTADGSVDTETEEEEIVSAANE
jgi:small subunit ribosomal protein S1